MKKEEKETGSQRKKRLVLDGREDTRAVKDCLHGKSESFEFLVKKYQDPVYYIAYRMVGNQEEAKDLARGFVDKHPDHLNGYPILCEVLWARAEFSEALERLNNCPDPPARSLDLLLLRGETLMQAGRPEQAAQLYENALDSEGWRPDMARSLALACEAQGKKEQARDLYGRILSDCPACGASTDIVSKRRFAELSLEMGDFSSRVLELYLSLAQEDPEQRAEHYEKISRIYRARGNREEARRFREFSQQALME